MKTIYLTRHGETEYNRLRIVQGSGIDSDLNAVGKAQAQAFFEHYRDVAFDKIYTSKLKRTIQSVQSFIDLGIEVEHHEGLNEISWGRREGKVVNEEEDKYYEAMLHSWAEGNTNFAIDGGESPEDVLQRQKPVLDLLLTKPEEETILICMHGRAMRILLTAMLNYPLKDMDTFEHSNLCLYKLVYTGSMFRVDLHNDTAHLKDLKLEEVNA